MPRYSIRSCATSQTANGHSNNFRQPGVVYKVNGACWEVLAQIQGSSVQPGDISLDNVENSYSGPTACSQCTTPPQQTVYYFSTLRPCGNTNSLANFQVYRDNADLTIGSSAKDPNGLCHTVISTEGSGTTIPQGAVNAIAFIKYQDCDTCNNPPPPPGGGSSGGGTTVYLYKIKNCQAQSSAAIIDAYRETTDLFPDYALKVDGICHEVVASDTNGTAVNINNVPAGSTDIRNIPRIIQGCGSCTNDTGFNCTPNGCVASTNGSGTYSTLASCQAVCKSYNCTNGQCVEQQGSGGSYPTSQACSQVCQSLGGSGTSGTALAQGFACSNGVCTPFNYDSSNGTAEEQGLGFSTLAACQQSSCGASGYNCTFSGCVASTSGAGTYTTIQACNTACKNWNCGQSGCVQANLPGSGVYGTQQECSSNCQGVSQTIWECELINCLDEDDTMFARKGSIATPGQVYKFPVTSTTWKCYSVISAVGTTQPSNMPGATLDGKNPYTNCIDCIPTQTEQTEIEDTTETAVCCFVGDSKVLMSDGSYKCIKDVELGEYVKTSSGESSKVVDIINPIIGDRGLLSINDGNAFATPDHIFKSVDGLWLTANIELSRKSFKAFDQILSDGGIIKQLSIGDYIITESGPVLIESFEIINSGIFDETPVYDLKLDFDGDHTYFVDSFAAHNCEPPTFCQQYPDHPTCQPCYNNPCLAGCPLNCDECPDDPRCAPGPGDPCDSVPEPVYGALLKRKFVMENWAVPEPSQYLYMIDPCWRWKYCVCRSESDQNLYPGNYDYRVCLCGEEPEPNVPNPCPLAGAFVRYECRNSQDPTSETKLEKWAVYTNGSCGTYDQKIEDNSVYCGFMPIPGCPQTGTLIRHYCVNSDRYAEYHDGKCGKYIEKVETNSKNCGYVDPSPPPPPPPPKVIVQPVTPATVYYPIRTENTLRGTDVTSFALWSNSQPYLQTPSTESLASSGSTSYILSVYDKSPDTAPTCSAELQYKIIYADYQGKGAKDLGGLDSETLTKAMYTQYSHILLPHGQTKFNFNGIDEDYVYIIDISRNRFKQSLDPGNWQLTLAKAEMGVDSNLTDLMTASYATHSISLVDNITNTIKKNNSIYLTSQNYDIVLGTIEEGVGSIYVSSSLASGSITRFQQPEYTSFTSTTSNTTYIVKPAFETITSVVATGAEAIPFIFTNATSSVKLERIYSEQRDKWGNFFYFSENDANKNYRGSFTGSFTGSYGGTFIPSVISGSLWGYYDTNENKFKLGTFWAGDVKYTTGSITYNGFLKFTFQDGGKAGTVYDCPSCLDAYISGTIGQSIITGSTTGSAVGYLMADSWGIDSIIGTSTTETVTVTTFATESVVGPTISTTYTELPNGNIIYPIRSDVFGRVFPSHGIIVLSGRKLDELGFNTNRTVDEDAYNTFRLFKSMKLVLDQNLTDFSGDKLGFYARGVDIKHAARYFITLKNSNLNYSNNPTYVTGSNGDIIDGFLRQNKAYFTSIGLYNTDKELLAIGKISKPIMSSLTDEMLFTVKVTQ